MLFFLSGANESLIERTIVEILKKYPYSEKLSLLAKDVTPSQLVDIANTFNILQQPPLITLRFDKQTIADDYYNKLKDINAQTSVIFVFPFELSTKHVFCVNPDNIKLIKGDLALKPVSDVFKFTDFLFSGNRKGAYHELDKLLEDGNDGFYIASMCLYSMRNIFYTIFNSPELKDLKDYPKKKALFYSQYFNKDTIVELFDYFYLFDKSCKTGQLEMNIALPLLCEKVLSYTRNR